MDRKEKEIPPHAHPKLIWKPKSRAAGISVVPAKIDGSDALMAQCIARKFGAGKNCNTSEAALLGGNRELQLHDELQINAQLGHSPMTKKSPSPHQRNAVAFNDISQCAGGVFSRICTDNPFGNDQQRRAATAESRNSAYLRGGCPTAGFQHVRLQ